MLNTQLENNSVKGQPCIIHQRALKTQLQITEETLLHKLLYQ